MKKWLEYIYIYIYTISTNSREEVHLLFKRIYIKTDGKRKRREKMNKEITIIYRKLDSIIKEFIDA